MQCLSFNLIVKNIDYKKINSQIFTYYLNGCFYKMFVNVEILFVTYSTFKFYNGYVYNYLYNVCIAQK
jgi:hypothetical protein